MQWLGQNNIWKVVVYDMMDFKNMNNNIISNRWKERYEKLSGDVKKKLNDLDNADISEYQLQVIKRKRNYPLIGDIFEINPKENLFFNGIVVNNHINNLNGEDLLLVFIFKENLDMEECIKEGVKSEDLLLPPKIVGKEYWTRGYFYNIAHYDKKFNIDSYGFYSVGKGKFFDEYGKEIGYEPRILGTYGVSTIIGIAMEINRELIIAGII